MIDSAYRKRYEAVFRALSAEKSRDAVYESALLSYVHGNPLMSRLFWRRIEAAFRLAGDLRNRAALDFGCGPGVTFAYLRENQCSITGCDNQFAGLAADVCKRLDIKADLCAELSEVRGRKFDVIFALDVLEHVEDLDPVLNSLLALAHDGTRIIVSGPTETVLYRLGRLLSGFSGHSHVRNIYDIEKMLERKKLKRLGTKNLYFPITLFRVSSWTKAK